ncbi:hypothetical protein GQ457_07G015020 [Hibiscus cannabinus]
MEIKSMSDLGKPRFGVVKNSEFLEGPTTVGGDRSRGETVESSSVAVSGGSGPDFFVFMKNTKNIQIVLEF